MIRQLGEKFTNLFKRYMPNAFVFALILTIAVVCMAFAWTGDSAMDIIQAWYTGFWMLLEFGMQMILILVTGFSIALSPLVKKGISKLTQFIHTPKHVYPFIIVMGMLLSAISWGWVVINAILAREFALRIKGINYPYLIACVYFSSLFWVTGLSSSIPLLLNTENNYLIEAGILSSTISTSYTLSSFLNISIMIFSLIVGPLLFLVLIPKKEQELVDMLAAGNAIMETTIEAEADSMNHRANAVSDRLNSSSILQGMVGLMGLAYIVFHFSTKGMDINLNIMIFVFIILGLFLHRTPMRYSIAMKRSSMNISGILFQYPFYAGIMGIMIHTGLGNELATWMVSVATIDTYPILAFLSGGGGQLCHSFRRR
ncbi:short-chain fatty acids transporter [Lewinella aquimaris]|uniref:Short-chain fatty acids transporter n=1 Tax=Neolewinella aquimaris TaxID=1835722 RepID=A0A840DYJ9_9BACT|nr:TIGR00366 family protein [Neolewinella aquimaris]MBB4077990.1 short-chain fatty acids transporter [Neolewinella aquimaris]